MRDRNHSNLAENQTHLLCTVGVKCLYTFFVVQSIRRDIFFFPMVCQINCSRSFEEGVQRNTRATPELFVLLFTR